MNHSTSVITENSSPEEVEQAVDQIHADYQKFRAELGETIVGMEDVIEQLTIAMICRGHCILQGMPGLAKTLLISQMGKLLDLSFNRIQFTPDLMPADITGSEVLQEDRSTGKRVSFGLSKAQFSATYYWLTRSIERHPKARVRCSKRWKSGR